VVSLLDVTSGLRPEVPVRRALTDLVQRFPDIRVEGAPSGEGPGLPDLSGITLDSRAVQPGDLYAALPGTRTHGAAFAAQVLEAGAVAILTDPEGARITETDPARRAVPLLVTDDPRGLLGAVSSWVYGDPTAKLRLLGVTGTNGKTTVTYLLDAGLRAAGETTGLVGTVETRVAGRAVPSTRTTPEAPDLQALFATMLAEGVGSAAMEVSSHALALHRVDGCHFAGASFTNLSQDHLDFHADMDDYFEAKAMLFERARSEVVVIDVDDPAGRRLLSRRSDAVPVSGGTAARNAAWAAEDIRSEPGGSRFRLRGPGGRRTDVQVPLPGAFNVANAVVALALLAETGIPLEPAAAGIAALPGVPGRMEKVDAGQPFLAVVDYAHTPAAVTTLLETVRQVVPGRVIVVLGCGGDRDRAKRPLMGAAAIAGADVAVFTSDNPRSEDPQAILDAMVLGVAEVPAEQRGTLVVEADRATAIGVAVERARAGDALIVAGKGHETGQVAHDVITPFDDRIVLRRSLLEAAGGGSSTCSR
jgi:UDP-N-acetylmuramoyl-L-alanyl-D-glutamate--2,6-diaminopimelate ligase